MAKLSKSVVKRLKVVRGEDWWVDESKQNGIGAVCFFCDKLIDWPPTDHAKKCPVREYINLDQEPPEFIIERR